MIELNIYIKKILCNPLKRMFSAKYTGAFIKTHIETRPSKRIPYAF